MKRSKDNRVVVVTFFAEDEADADRIQNEVADLATNHGCNWVTIDHTEPTTEHIKLAEEQGIFDDSR